MKAYYCIGGPLDGSYATTKDFQKGYTSKDYPKWNREEGMYSHLSGQYYQFNSGGSHRCPMLWIHNGYCKPPIRPRDR